MARSGKGVSPLDNYVVITWRGLQTTHHGTSSPTPTPPALSRHLPLQGRLFLSENVSAVVLWPCTTAPQARRQPIATPPPQPSLQGGDVRNLDKNGDECGDKDALCHACGDAGGEGGNPVSWQFHSLLLIFPAKSGNST